MEGCLHFLRASTESCRALISLLDVLHRREDFPSEEDFMFSVQQSSITDQWMAFIGHVSMFLPNPRLEQLLNPEGGGFHFTGRDVYVDIVDNFNLFWKMTGETPESFDRLSSGYRT